MPTATARMTLPVVQAATMMESNMNTTPERLRPRSNKRRRRTGMLPILIIEACLLAITLLPSKVHAQFGICFEELGRNDANEDTFLDRNDFADFMISLTGGAVNLVTDSDVPFAIIQAYLDREDATSQSMPIIGAAGQDGATPEDIAFLESFCTDIFTEVYAFLEITVDPAVCNAAIALANQDGDGDLSTVDSEFFVFVNALGREAIDPPVEFTTLPNRVNAAFRSFEDTNVVPIEGSSEEFLIDLCTQTVFTMTVAQSEGDGVEPGSGGDPGDGGTDPGTGPTLAPDDEFSTCVSSLALADFSEDRELDQAEYVAFVNALGENRWGNLEYEELPAVLRENFDLFDEGAVGFIDISGATFNGNPNEQFLVALQTLCQISGDALRLALDLPVDTLVPSPAVVEGTPAPSALTEGTSGPTTPTTTGATAAPSVLVEGTSAPSVLSAEGTSAPTSAPTTAVVTTSTPTVVRETAAPSAAPTLSVADFELCKTNMIVSDLTRDDRIDQGEYVRFLNRQTSNEFAGLAYDELDSGLRSNFAALDGGLGYLDVNGSKPGQEPSDEQLEVLQRICGETAAAVDRFFNPVPTVTPASFPTPEPVPTTGAPTVFEAPTISDSFFQLCKNSMVVSDLSRDDQLEPIEYIRFLNRLVQNSFSGLVFDELPPVFQDSYMGLTGSNMFVNVFGSKPGQNPSDEEIENLFQICTSTDAAISEYNNPVTEPTPAPAPTAVPLPTTARPTSLEAPTRPPITAAFLLQCTTALVVADLSRDDLVNQPEYVRFLNRLLSNLFVGIEYEDIDPIFQASYATLTGGDEFVDVGGSKPGQDPTEAQLTALEAICIETDSAIGLYNDKPPETEAPTTAPTSSPLDDSDVQRCTDAMSLSDLNSDDRLNQPEYVRFLNGLSQNEFLGLTFSELSPVLQRNYDELGEGRGLIDVAGSKPGDTPTDEQSDALLVVCVETFAALDFFFNPVPTVSPTSDTFSDPHGQCKATLALSDSNGDLSLDRDEYVTFLGFYTQNEWEGLDFTELPYLLQDNFEWIVWGSTEADITGARTNDSPSADQKLYLDWACTITDRAIESARDAGADAPTTFSGQCLASMATSDTDENDFLSKTELVSFLNSLVSNAWEGYAYESLSMSLRVYFENTADIRTAELNVEGSNPGDNPSGGILDRLTFLCSGFEEAIVEARSETVEFEQCRVSLTTSDQDEDSALSQEEYVPFAYQFSGANATRLSFADIDQTLQDNFDTIETSVDSVDIAGSYPGDVITTIELRNLRFICSSTSAASRAVLVAPSVSPTTAPADDTLVTTVFNSFVIANTENIRASDLDNGDSNRRGLEDAYALFVSSVVDDILDGSTRLRGRRLTALGVVFDSAILYEVEDAGCPLEVQDSAAVCQVVFGSFDLRYIDESNPDSLAATFSAATQAKIDSGDLQSELSGIDSQNRFEIVSGSEPVRPFTPAPSSAPGPDDEDDGQGGDDGDDDDGPGLFVIIGASAGVAVLVLALVSGIYLCYTRKKGPRKPTLHDNASDAGKTGSGGGLFGKPAANNDSSGADSDGLTNFNVQEEGFNVSSRKDEDQFGTFVNSEEAADQKQIDNDDFFGGKSKSTEPQSKESEKGDWGANPWGAAHADDEVVDVVSTSESESEGQEAFVQGGADESFFDSEETPPAFGFDDQSQEAFDFQAGDPPGEDSAVFEDVDEYEEESVEEESVEESVEEESVSEEESVEDESASEGDEDQTIDDETIDGETDSMTSEERQVYAQYRAQLEALVTKVVPDELDNIDTMMEQFAGREEELILTLQNMAGGDGSSVAESEYETEEEEESSDEEEEEEEESEGEYEESEYEDETEYEEESEADEEDDTTEYEDESEGEEDEDEEEESEDESGSEASESDGGDSYYSLEYE